MISLIYLDMDGVLADFDQRYIELFGVAPKKVRDEAWGINWTKFIQGNHFSDLPWYPGGKELFEFVHNTGIHYQILSSSGGNTHHEEVERQKKHWLTQNNILAPVNIVPGKEHKAKYATPSRLLIDDKPSIIDSFVKSGGLGIIHTDLKSTLKTLQSFLYESAYW